MDKPEFPNAPKTWDEVFKALDGILSDEDRETLRDAKDLKDLVINLHHGFGTYLRNTFGLWHGSATASCT